MTLYADMHPFFSPSMIPCSLTAQLGQIHAVLNTLKESERRDFAKQCVAMVTHLAAWQPAQDASGSGYNAMGKLFNEYHIPFTTPLPRWFKRLAREFAENAEPVVKAAQHRPVINELRRVKPATARSVSGALHYVLAQYEYKFLDACFEYAQSIGLELKDDCLDGGLWLAASFPAGHSVDSVFRDMTNYARQATGMEKFTIRMKKIELPELPSMKTAKFEIRSYMDLGEAGADTIFASMDRHFTSLTGRAKAVVVERIFYPNSDIVEYVIERTDAEFISVYKSCKLTVSADGGKPKAVPVPLLWLDRTCRPTAHRLDFVATAAERDGNPNVLSCFTGLFLDSSTRVDYETCLQHPGVQIIEDHVRTILANGDPATYDYLRRWHAYAVQKRTKSGVMVVFVGLSGTGKSTLYFKSTHNHPIFKTIFGNTYQGTNGVAELTARWPDQC